MMKLRPKPYVLAAAALLTVATARGLAEEVGERFLDLTRGGKPAALLVVPDDDGPIWADAVRMIAGTAERWGGAPPRVVRLGKDAPLPAGDLIVLGTADTSRMIAELSELTESRISRVPFTDRHGFAIESRAAGGAKHMVIAGKTPRGAYNGAVLCRDFLLDATAGPAGKADVYVRSASILRSPQMAARGTYHLSLYGVAMRYTAEDWMKIVDRYAEDGMNRVCFWLSGHHPSQKYPQLYNVDATKGTQLTVDGVTRLIHYCHDRGIDFYIGGGVFAWCAAGSLAEGHPEIAAVKAGGICPSKPYSRTGNREHFLEMYDTWPEADGFMLEIRDEQGECRCEDCQVKLDEFGSKSYGRAEITWLQEFAREAWKRNPRLRFCWLIGYAEHTNDVYYYDQIRRISDPRFEWLDTRVGLGENAFMGVDPKARWVLPGPGNVKRPFAFFSRRISHWDPYYKQSIEWLHRMGQRIADEGLYGYMPAFEPGFGSGSYYYDEIPLPVHILPFCLTGFVYREVTWDPSITLEELKRRIQHRYFSPNAPEGFVEDMIFLQQFSFDHWQEISFYAKPRLGYSGETIGPLIVAEELKRVQAISDENQRKGLASRLLTTFKRLANVPEHLARMDRIEAALDEATSGATPKTLEGFAILRRLIHDTRKLYPEAVPDRDALAEAIATLGG